MFCQVVLATLALFFVVYFGTLAAQEVYWKIHQESPTEPPTPDPPTPAPPTPAPLGWAISGNGNRAMFGAMGFARAYDKSKLFANAGEQLAAVSSNSGGSWFLSQFAYSGTFYESVTTGDMNALISAWFKETGKFYKLDCKSLKCKTKYKAASVFLNQFAAGLLERFSDLGPGASKAAQEVVVAELQSVLGTAVNSEMNWARMVTTWITTATPDINTRTLADPASRAGGMTSPTLHFQTAVAASAFVAGATKTNYISQNSAVKQALSMTSVPFQWVVPGKQTSDPSRWLAKSTEAKSAVVVQPDTTTAFYAQGATLPTTAGSVPVPLGAGSIWGGKAPPATLIASASSAAVGSFGSPSLLETEATTPAQILASYFEAQVTNSGANSDRMSSLLAKLPDMAVCSSAYDSATGLPARCGAPGDAALIDGGYVDNLGVGQMIGTMQKRFPGQRLRFILNDASDMNTMSSALYFQNSPYSGGAAPGGPTNLWWPNMTVALAQIFDTDWSDVKSSLRPVPASTTSFKPVQDNATLTYTTVSTTTVANDYYGCAAGTKVDLLIFELNNNLPMFYPYTPGSIVESETIKLYTDLAGQCASPEVTAILDRWLLDSK